MKRGTMKQSKKEDIVATRAEFDRRWGVADVELPDGSLEVDEVQDAGDGTQLIKLRLIPVLIDPSKSYEDDNGNDNGNLSPVSNMALTWLSNQPESYVPGVAELFKQRISEHRHGISGGVGSSSHQHASNAVARVLASMSPKEIETAKAAAQRLADRLVQVFPKSSINEPTELAATPEERIDHFKKDESAYQHVN